MVESRSLVRAGIQVKTVIYVRAESLMTSVK